jgi:hypothetical protein
LRKCETSDCFSKSRKIAVASLQSKISQLAKMLAISGNGLAVDPLAKRGIDLA